MPTIHRPESRQQVRRLSARECRAWLASHREGRLGYQTGRGPRSVVVRYAITDEQIMFRLPDYNDIVHYVPGERVTLEVEGLHAAVGDFDTVLVTGEARLAAHHASVVQATQFEEHWPAGVATSVICLPMTEVEGFERNAVALVGAR